MLKNLELDVIPHLYAMNSEVEKAIDIFLKYKEQGITTEEIKKIVSDHTEKQFLELKAKASKLWGPE